MTPIDASRLDVTLTEGERWRRTLSVTVPADIVQAEQAALTRQLASRMKIKGFRSGRVPADVIAKRYGPAVEREALDHVIQEAYKEALSGQELRPISEGEIEDVTFAPSEPLTFKVSFDVQPEIQLDRLSGFKATRPAPNVPDDAVDRVIERLQNQNGAWAPAEEGPPDDNDLVSVQVTRLDGEDAEPEPRPYEFVLGQGNAIPDIEGAIKELEIGGEGEFEITFPDDFPDEDRRGETQRIHVLLESRKVLELPEPDDAFAKSLGEFEDIAALRAKIEEDLAKDAERQAEGALRGQLLQLVLEANRFEVPRSMVDGYIDSIVGNPGDIDPEKLAELKTQLHDEAEAQVKRMLALRHVAEQQDLRATEDEIDERVQSITERTGEPAGKVYASLQKSGQLDALEQELTEDKVFEFLKSSSEITEAP